MTSVTFVAFTCASLTLTPSSSAHVFHSLDRIGDFWSVFITARKIFRGDDELLLGQWGNLGDLFLDSFPVEAKNGSAAVLPFIVLFESNKPHW